MKPRAFKLFVFLLAGAIINVAVAWGCAISVSHGTMSDSVAELEEQVCQYLASRYGKTDWRSSCNGAGVCRRFGYERLRAIYFGGPDASGGLFQAFVEECTTGWPNRCVRGGSVQLGNGDFATHDCKVLKPGSWTRVTELPLGADFASDAAYPIPYNPIFPGFAINTIFYAAIVWFLFFAPGVIRKRVRRKRGQCAACGYTLRGSAGDKCSECGNPWK